MSSTCAAYLVFILPYLSHVLGDCGEPFEEVVKWKQIEFDYARSQQQKDKDNGDYIPGNIAPLDLAVHYRSGRRRIFVTIPRFIKGSPVTLGVLSGITNNGNRLITPYPQLSWHQSPDLCNKNRLISVFRVAIDRCNRLWVIDSGQYDNNLLCPPQIVIFDLATDKVIRQFDIPLTLYDSLTYFVTPIVDVRERCDNAFLYVADCQTFSILVYSYRKNRAWSVQDRTMYPNPYWGYKNYRGEMLQLMDGVLGMALEPYVRGKDLKLFYHSLSAETENWVYTSKLRNENLFSENPLSSPQIFQCFPTTRGDTSAGQAIDSNGIAYFGSLTSSAILCWNTKSRDYGKFIDTVYQNKITMDFASGVKVVKNPQGVEYVWVLTSRFQKALLKTYNTDQVNFRISRLPVSRVLETTKCGRPNVAGNKCGKYVRRECKTCGYSLNNP